MPMPSTSQAIAITATDCRSRAGPDRRRDQIGRRQHLPAADQIDLPPDPRPEHRRNHQRGRIGAKYQLAEMPRSCAMGSAKSRQIALDAQARVWVVPSARMTGSRPAHALSPWCWHCGVCAAFARRRERGQQQRTTEGGGVEHSRLPLSSHIARHNGAWTYASPRLMNWLVSQGLTGLPENDLLRGFCERCRAEGLDLSRGLVVIDTLHPVFEGRGFRWNDSEPTRATASNMARPARATPPRTGGARCSSHARARP